MHFVITNYGNDYIPLLNVCLDSIGKEHPKDKVTVLWDEMSDIEVMLLKQTFPKVNFQEQNVKIPNDNIHKRIPTKLKFWSKICTQLKDETIVLLDSDTLVYQNISDTIK